VVKSLQALAQDWQALSPLLDKALALPTEERAAWLERLGPQAEGLRPRLRELLDLQDDVRTRGFLEALPVLPGLQAPALAVQVGDQVGPYRLVDEIGRGGMGTVWLAERADGLLKRRCALKLPLLAWSNSLRDRMAQERDILAGLDHPHIARLLDTGVDDQGRPFLALEHVQGEPIDAWLDAKKLPVRERVALFVQVVDAIRYAHANLVIHRDLKPSNILVTAQGQAKLLDFGIAKLLSDASTGEPSDLTLTGQRLLTPRYASPEQILGQRLTAASDVYSLGVLLHELLCGQPPYAAGRTPDKLPEQAVLEADVRAPSRLGADAAAAARRGTTPDKLVRQLRGELDAIVLRALARAPQERYASAEAMQADLRAWLEGRPVQARNPGALAVAWKFMRRHRWPVGIGAAGLGATLVMAAVATVMGLESEQEARRAEQEARKALDSVRFALDMFKGADPLVRQGRDINLRELLEQAEARVESDYAGQPQLREQVYRQVAELWARFGEHARRAAALEKRAQVLQALGDQTSLATNLMEQARITLDLLNDIDGAEKLLDRFQAVSRSRLLPEEELFDHDLWRGWIASDRRDHSSALTAFQEAERRARMIGRPFQLALSLRGKAQAEHRLGRWQEADRVWREASSLARDTALDWKPHERRAVRWELAQEALRIGRWLEGWAEVQDLMRADEAERGPFSLSSFGDQLLWLHYCVLMRQERQASQWLAARRRSFEEKAAPPVNEQWLLAEATVMGLMGQQVLAQRLLVQAGEAAARLPPGPVLHTWHVSRTHARLRLAVHETNQRAIDRAVADLTALETEIEAQTADGSMSRLLALSRALAERMRVGSSVPIPLLAKALATLESTLGPDHPETLALGLNLALQRWQVSPDPPRAQEAAIASRRLRDRLPADHAIGQWAADLGDRLDRWAGGLSSGDTEKSALLSVSRRVILF
jgi:serine/threonine-protein kinase